MGILPQYTDAHGKCVQTNAAVKRALLKAMGVDVTGEREAEQHLTELERAEWLRSLPPVKVFSTVDRAPIVEVTLPKSTAEIEWSVQLEDGDTKVGHTTFSALDFVVQREVDGR